MSPPGRITSSAGGRAGQWGPACTLARGLAFSLAVGLALSACHKNEPAKAEGRPTPSGLPVPRYVALKFATVNARGGPGDDYRLLWVYHARRLPLQVIAETTDWRRVCDPDGGVAWVHRRTVDSRRSVMRVDSRELIVRRSPSEAAPRTALLVGRGLADLETCKDGWCRLKVANAAGWVRASEVWGAVEGRQCR